jgi:hypothetical protein
MTIQNKHNFRASEERSGKAETSSRKTNSSIAELLSRCTKTNG